MTETAQTPEPGLPPDPDHSRAADTALAAGTDTVADAVRGNWVDRLAPVAARPYLRLSRADRPVGTWLLLTPCLWGMLLGAHATGPRPWDLWIVAGCAMGALLMRGAGCTWNDITDRHIDAGVARTRSRPLPSGQVSVRQALVWLVLQALAAFAILLTYNGLSVWMGAASLALVAVYPFAKRFTWWPQAFLGLAFNWGALIAYAMHAGRVDPAAIVLYAAGIAWTLFYDTIYAHQDTEDDALIGVKSTARLFGANSRVWLGRFLVASVALMGVAVLLALLGPAEAAPRPVALALGLGGVWAFGWHLSWQLQRLDPDDPASCLRIFRSNRDAGLIPALFLAVALLA